MSVCGITRPLGRLSPSDRQVAHVLRTRSPVTLAGPRDLQVMKAWEDSQAVEYRSLGLVQIG